MCGVGTPPTAAKETTETSAKTVEAAEEATVEAAVEAYRRGRKRALLRAHPDKGGSGVTFRVLLQRLGALAPEAAAGGDTSKHRQPTVATARTTTNRKELEYYLEKQEQEE